MKQLLKVTLAIFFVTNLNIVSAYSENDPFPGVAEYGEIPGTRVLGQQSITCPEGSGSAIEANATTKETFTYCVKTWRPAQDINADLDFRNRIDAATAAAEAESRAWNAANPGKQKCVQWGPIVHANGVSTSSGGVCANPISPGSSTTVQSQETTGVTGPSNQPISQSTSSSSGSNPAAEHNSEPVGFKKNSGSGYPFTVILEGQKSINDCPIGYQAGTGIIAQIGTGTFTECWPENALAAWRLGGIYWEQFKSSGGSFDVQLVLEKLATIEDYKKQAKNLAQKAADETPGIQRCSNWSVYGETGQECAYTFVSPESAGSNTSNGSSSTGSGATASDTSTAIAPITNDSSTSAVPTLSTIDSTTQGTVATPSNQNFLSASAAPSLGIAATTFTGKISEVASLVKKVESISSIQNAVVGAVEKLQKVANKTFSRNIKLPDLRATIETAKSLTPNVCSINNLNVSVITKGTCKIEYSITSSSGNTYITEKTIEFRRN